MRPKREDLRQRRTGRSARAPTRSRIGRGPLAVTVSDVFSGILRHHGVKAVFGNPGSNELSFLTGRPDGIPYYVVLQEGAAIDIADGFAQW
ncbi:hypothetical protein CG723_30490 [Streptomyces sp. CB01635]|uniref:thiamine pyrophosphate-binding protein n=1 Tax=unclassified Streptomyces TaxID=2593676 RepID=UPI000C27E9A9|nr:thiamine pyrophosphate-binding protein [Streptomyces sp. CB01635]PJN08022.1 hypothetical protein CG723_30490 [Streptomyces sp. CB01635]